MLNKFSRIARRIALSTLVASCLAINTDGMTQEPFFLIPSDTSGKSASSESNKKTETAPKADRPKQKIPNIPAEPARDTNADSPPAKKSSLSLEEPPRLISFPAATAKNPSKSNVIEDDGVLMLGKIEEPAGGSFRNNPKSIAPINDQLPVVRHSPQVREVENSRVGMRDDAPLNPIDAIPSLTLPWQLANASSFPFSPIHLWQGIRRDPLPQLIPIENAIDTLADTAAESTNLDQDHVDAQSSGQSSEVANSDAMTDDVESNLVESNEAATTGVIPRRNVRIPFGDEDTIDTDESLGPPASKATPQSTLAELEEQKGQEAPIIDSKSLDRAKDEQGADALRAAKPATPPKRIIKIDDPQSNGQVVPVKPADAPAILNAADALRLRRAQSCLDHYLNFPESTSVRSPWAVMHALLPFGGDYEMIHGNQRVNAIGWMCHNGTCRTQRIFTPSRNGFTPNIGGGVQGHAGQFMAILAQCGVPLDYPIQVGNKKYKVEDLVRYEMATCREKSELTFKLIGLSYYLDSNKQWKSNDGKLWSIPKLISEELAQPIKGAACGGTHRLMGYTFAVKQRSIQGLPIDGQFARADKFIKDYVEYAWKLQNPDGSFSTSWLEGRGDEPNEERKVQTTGHILEWLLFTIPDSELNTPKVQKSVDFLLTKIYDKKEYKWPIGPRGHATRAVSLYLNRYDEIKMSKPELLRAETKTASPRSSEPFNRR